MSFLNTVTHEIAHSYEFITNANGLTPNKVFDLNSCGDLSFDIFEVCTGVGIRYKGDDSLMEQDIIDIMEERVEELGFKWLRDIKIDNNLLEKALDYYAP